ncbi:crotonase/enoyl-CoA hydratase family protein [Ottowia sp.]|uniref:crotonase/enoyl-CoA hydratase family protein n=1 Tax=Ottowia sp. TaxID=1898956 RepID=UPI0039E27DE9
MNGVVGYQLDEGVATLTLNNGKANAVSHAVLDGLNAGLDRAIADQAVVILTGQPGMLSGGYDLTVMKAGPAAVDALVTGGSSLALRMLAHPYPVIVACPGHAVAKGAFLLLSADYRIGVEGPYKIGLNEVAIGMTMHDAGIALARHRLHRPAFERSVVCGEMFDPAGALAAGFLDALAAPDQLMATAHAAAERLKKLDMAAHRNTKLKARKALLDELAAGIQADSRNRRAAAAA